MAAESILIERMPGKSTVGIQVPNSERETIWLRDVVECESFAQIEEQAGDCVGQGHQWAHRYRGSGQHAARSDRGLDWLR